MSCPQCRVAHPPECGRKLFIEATCPVCLQLESPFVTIPCGHGVCVECFGRLGGALAPARIRSRSPHRFTEELRQRLLTDAELRRSMQVHGQLATPAFAGRAAFDDYPFPARPRQRPGPEEYDNPETGSPSSDWEAWQEVQEAAQQERESELFAAQNNHQQEEDELESFQTDQDAYDEAAAYEAEQECLEAWQEAQAASEALVAAEEEEVALYYEHLAAEEDARELEELAAQDAREAQREAWEAAMDAQLEAEEAAYEHHILLQQQPWEDEEAYDTDLMQEALDEEAAYQMHLAHEQVTFADEEAFEAQLHQEALDDEEIAFQAFQDACYLQDQGLNDMDAVDMGDDWY